MTTSESTPASLLADGAPGEHRIGDSTLEAARAKLDLALLSLRRVEDPEVPVRRAEACLRRALDACYRALVSRTEGLVYDNARADAIEGTRQTLAILQEQGSPGDLVIQTLGRTAGALGLLRSTTSVPSRGPRAPVGLDGQPSARFAPASIDVPALLEQPRGLWPAMVPMPPSPDPPPEVAPSDPPAVVEEAVIAITSVEALRAFAAASAARLAALEEADEAPAPVEPPADALPARVPPVATREADDEAAAALFGRPATSADLLVKRATLLLEELANLGNMRRPTGDEPWAAPRTEQRLLARVDALAACGDDVVLPLLRLLEDRPLPDPELTWALLFFLGAWPGDDAVDQIERLVLTADLGSPGMAAAVADALALVPHPGVLRPLQRWLRHREPALRGVALAALARRRTLEVSAAVAALDDPAPLVALEGARAFAHLGGRADGLARAALLRRVSAAPGDGASSEVLGLARASLTSAAILGSSAALDEARKVLQGQGHHGLLPEAALVVGLTGEAHDLDLLLHALATPVPAVVEALGWLGHLRALPSLFALLAEDVPEERETLKEPAAFALYRLTGAALTDDDDLAQNAVDEAPWPATFEPPSPPAKLTQKAHIWRAWWERHQGGADANLRYRYGRRWTAASTLWELRHRMTPTAARELLHIELVGRTGLAHLPLDREGFVVPQEAALDAMGEAAVRMGVAPGAFNPRLVRERP